jgi:hypothetical protein
MNYVVDIIVSFIMLDCFYVFDLDFPCRHYSVSINLKVAICLHQKFQWVDRMLGRNYGEYNINCV